MFYIYIGNKQDIFFFVLYFCMIIYIYFLQYDLGIFWYVREHRAIFIALVDNCTIMAFGLKFVLFLRVFISIYDSCFEVVDFNMFQSYCYWLLFRMIMKWLWSGYLGYDYFIFFYCNFLGCIFEDYKMKNGTSMRWFDCDFYFVQNRWF